MEVNEIKKQGTWTSIIISLILINLIIFIIPDSYPFNNSYWELLLFVLGGFIATYLSISNNLKISLYLGILFSIGYVPAIILHSTFNLALIIISSPFLCVAGGLIANQIRIRLDKGEGRK